MQTLMVIMPDPVRLTGAWWPSTVARIFRC
jgi:hypothetical protein